MAVTTYQYPRNSNSNILWQGSTYPSWYTAVSTNAILYSDFKYVFKTYITGAGGSLIGTSKNSQRVLENLGVFDSQPITNALVKSTFQPTISTWTTCTNSVAQYLVTLQEYYNGITYSPVTYFGGSSSASEQLIIKNNLDGFNGTNYRNYHNKSNLLTGKTTYDVRLIDYATLRMLNGNNANGFASTDSNPVRVRFDMYYTTGVTGHFYFQDQNPYLSTNSNTYFHPSDSAATRRSKVSRHLIEVGVGPKNIWNKIIVLDGVTYADGTYTPITPSSAYAYLILPNVVYYDVYVASGSNVQYSSKYRYNIICNNTTKPAIQLQWENLLGGIDNYLFTKVNSKTNTYSKSSFTKNKYQQGHSTITPNANMYIGYNAYDRGDTQIFNEQTEIYTLNSNWMSNTDAIDIESLWQSNSVFIYVNSIFYPATLLVDSIQITTSASGLKNYTFDVQISNKKININ